MRGNFQKPQFLLMGEMYFHARQFKRAFPTLSIDPLVEGPFDFAQDFGNGPFDSFGFSPRAPAMLLPCLISLRMRISSELQRT